MTAGSTMLSTAQIAEIAAAMPKATPEEWAADEKFMQEQNRLDEAREAVRHAPPGTAQYMLDIAIKQCAYDPYAMLLTLDPTELLAVTDQTILRPDGAEPPAWPVKS